MRHTEFATIRLRLLKIASRIIETASRIRVALDSCGPVAELFSLLASDCSDPDHDKCAIAPMNPDRSPQRVVSAS